MSLYKTEIFRQHPRAKSVLKKRRICMVAAWMSFAALVLFLFLIFPSPKNGANVLYLVTAVILVCFVSFCVLMRELTAAIETQIQHLALMYGMNAPSLSLLNVSEIQRAGRLELINKAGLLLAIQDEIFSLKLVNATPYIDHLIKEALDRELSKRQREISQLYDVLCEFDLVAPGGYGWAFERAKRGVRV